MINTVFLDNLKINNLNNNLPAEVKGWHDHNTASRVLTDDMQKRDDSALHLFVFYVLHLQPVEKSHAQVWLT